jgi:NhaC family Na+:H+ antiporter
VFIILGLFQDAAGQADTAGIQAAIKDSFTINGWLFIVPLVVIGLIVKKTPPLLALLIGTLLGAVFALIFQPDIIAKLGGGTELDFTSAYKGVLNSMGTIWLIMCAMVFGGIMDGIGALQRITNTLLELATSTFSLFASTVASCLALNLTASDQYLALVVPGKMFSKAYADRGMAPENLSRTLEDSGTVTSALIPWNTCGAYHSGVLGVGVGEYVMYAIFNYLSPFMTLLFAAFQIKIKKLVTPAV